MLARRRPRRKEDFYIVIFLSLDKGQVRLSSDVPLIKSLTDLLFLMLGISNYCVAMELISIICTQRPLSQINVTETLPTKDLFTSTFSFLSSHHQTRRHRWGFFFFLSPPPTAQCQEWERIQMKAHDVCRAQGRSRLALPRRGDKQTATPPLCACASASHVTIVCRRGRTARSERIWKEKKEERMPREPGRKSGRDGVSLVKRREEKKKQKAPGRWPFLLIELHTSWSGVRACVCVWL